MKYLNRAARWIRTWITQIVEAIGEWWRDHRHQMAEDDGYAEAFAAVLLAAVELLVDNHRVRYLAHELVSLYTAILRVVSPRFGWETTY